MNEKEIDISLLLQSILTERRNKNPNYSLRAFARDLKISSGRLSDILTRKNVPGQAVSERIISALSFNEEEIKKVQKIIENSKISKQVLGGAYQLSEHELSMITDWHHSAIITLMTTSNYRDEFSWIAGRLGLSEITVKESFEKMLALELIKIENGKHMPTHKKLTTSQDIPSCVLREANRQIIMQSLYSLEHDDSDTRDITSITLPINTANLPKAKVLIREFRRKLANILEEGEKTEVYNICVQVVPVTRHNN